MSLLAPSYTPGVTGVSGVAELALLLALLEVREPGLRVPTFFLKTLKKKVVVEKGSITLQTRTKASKHKGTQIQERVTYLTGFSR